MGTSYLSAVGAPPVCTKLAFRDWFLSLLAFRLAECPITRTTTYYFSQRGSDSTGNGANGFPFGTVSSGNYSGGTAGAGGGTLTFTGSPFTAYTWVKGDTINISAGTGITAGSYIITSKTDANNLVIGLRVGADGVTTVANSGLPTVSDSSITVAGGWYKTIAQMQILHDASAGNVCFRLKNGEVWRETFTMSRKIGGSGSTTTLQMIAATSIDGYVYPSDMPVGANITLSGMLSTSETVVCTSNAPTTGAVVVSANNGTGVTTGFNWNSSTLTLSKTNAFTAYTFAVGDVLNITAGNGATIGQYVVTGKTSASAITLATSPGATVADASYSIGGHTKLTWTQPAFLSVTKDNITLCAFGPSINGQKPTITAWQAAWNVTAAGSTKTSGKLFTYQIDSTLAGNTVAAVREENDVVRPYRQMASIAEVEDVPGSWWQDTAALITYVHPHGNQALKTSGFSSAGHAYQVIFNQNFPAVYLNNCDGFRIDGVRIDGYGCSTSAVVVPKTYGIKGSISGTQCAVVSDCEIYYSYNHNVGILCGSTGAIVTYFRVVYGWGSVNGDIVNYSAGGGQESILYQCVCRGSSLPIGYQYTNAGNTGSSNLSHSTYVTCTSANWSGTTVTVTNAGGAANGVNVSPIALAAGRQITLFRAGGTLTRTIASYDPATGTLVFTAIMDGNTYTSFQSSSLQYMAALYIVYECSADRGPFMAQSFAGPANAVPFTDLINARCFVIGCDYRKRNTLEEDKEYKIVTLSNAVQAATTATLTTPIGTTNLGASTNTDMMMGGGSEVPEIVRVSSYVNGTGVLTLHASTPIVGAARTWIRIPVGSAPSGSVGAGIKIAGSDYSTGATGAGIYDVVYLNCRWECGSLWTQNPGGVTPMSNAGACQGGYIINGTIVFDNSDVVSANGQTTLALATASGWYAKFDHCMIYFRFTGRYITGMETTALAASGTPTNVTLQNSIIVIDSNQNQTQLDLTQASNTGTIGAVGLGNSATLQQHNSYHGITHETGTWGNDQDPTRIVNMGKPPIDFRPTTDSNLVDGNTVLIDGVYTLEFDRQWNKRRTPTAVGPLESLTLTPGTVNRGSRQRARSRG